MCLDRSGMEYGRHIALGRGRGRGRGYEKEKRDRWGVVAGIEVDPSGQAGDRQVSSARSGGRWSGKVCRELFESAAAHSAMTVRPEAPEAAKAERRASLAFQLLSAG